MAAIGLVANGPAQTTATIAKQADAEFFNKNRIVNEKIINDKTDKILSQNKFKLPIDTVMDAGGWKLGLKLDGTGRMHKSSIGRDFSFGDRTEMLTTSTWGPNTVNWLGLEGIEMDAKVVEEDGKLSMVFTAKDWESKVRTIILKDGEQPEFIFNNGVKDTSDKGCVTRFSDVRKNGEDISLTVQLVKDFSSQGGVVVDEKNPLTFPPNFRMWGEFDVAEAKPQNYMELTVQDTVKFMLATGNGHGYDYKEKLAVQALNVDAIEGYTYPDRADPYFNWALNTSGSTRRVLKGALYELGMRDSSGIWIRGKTYGRPLIAGVLPDSMNGLPVFMQNSKAGGPNILAGDLNGLAIPPDYIPSANWFLPMEYNNMRKEVFVLRFDSKDLHGSGKNGPYADGEGVIGFRFEKATNDYGPYYLKDGKMDYGNIYISQESQTWMLPMLETKGRGTDTVYANNQRVRVIDNRHIIIEDITPESMKGDKYYTPQALVTPYEKSQDTTHVGVPDPIAHSSVLKVYPNPASDQLTIEAVGDGRQMFVNLTDLYGRVVKNVYNGVPENGSGTFPLNTSDLPSGVYFLQVRGTGKAEAIKVEIIR